MKELELIKFIKKNKDWKQLLKKDPYNLSINEVDNRVIFAYNMSSDFNEEIVKECRGIILDKRDWSIVCNPYYKFFNLHEEKYHKNVFNFKNYKIFEKLDGSLIKIYFYDNEWRVSSNGAIIHEEIEGIVKRIFKNKFNMSVNDFFMENDYDKDKTYLFELLCKEYRVVVFYEEEDLVYLGSRDNKTGKELLSCDNRLFKTPKEYSAEFSNLESIVNFLKTVQNFEGFVLVDDSFNRLKVKAEEYLRLHYFKSIYSIRNGFEIIFKQEESEVLSYLNTGFIKREYEIMLEDINAFFKKCYENYEKYYEISKTMDRKTSYHNYANEIILAKVFYSLYGKNKLTFDEYFEAIKNSYSKRLKIIEQIYLDEADK